MFVAHPKVNDIGGGLKHTVSTWFVSRLFPSLFVFLFALDTVKRVTPLNPRTISLLSKVRPHPTDSRGETVYEGQGVAQKDQPVVSGVFAKPSAVNLPSPKYPKSLKKSRSDADVTLEGVISQNGDFIDVTVVDAVAPEIAKAALDAVARYKFQPATLDGKPIALLARVAIHFRVR
jgi:TonB family protein